MLNNFKNESEFIFDEKFKVGFTVLPNNVLLDSRLTDGAIGLYCRIIRCANIADWKIYQSSLVNQSNKKGKIASEMKNLIEVGYIKKIQLRDEKGRMCGVSYKVFSEAQTVENTTSEPKPKKPISVCPTSENQPLINKEDNKRKIIINKDSSSSMKIEEKKEEERLDEIAITSLEENEEIELDINIMTDKPYTTKEKVSMLQNILTNGFASRSLLKVIDKASSEDIYQVVTNCYEEGKTHASIYIENNLKGILGYK